MMYWLASDFITFPSFGITNHGIRNILDNSEFANTEATFDFEVVNVHSGKKYE